MQKRSILEEDVNRVCASMGTNGSARHESTGELEGQKREEFDVYVEEDRITVVKRPESQTQVIESTPVPSQETSLFPAYAICLFYLILILSILAFQVYELLNPPIATITIVPKTKTVSLSGTLQLGRVLQPLTLSQSQTVTTTGEGHQDPKSATGFITFYNGQFQRVTIAAGTTLTGADGIQVTTDQDATIPKAYPPLFGQTTVSAHAIRAGSIGNIEAFDINEACCLTSVLAKNITSFTGGKDERNFQTVAESDLDTAAPSLKIAVAQSMEAALQGQLKTNEQLQILHCAPTIASDHQPGQEASQVKVTVSVTCSAIAYDTQALETRATKLLTTQALTKLATGYSLTGNVQVRVNDATITNTSQPLVFLSFHAQGTWIYALSHSSQQQITRLIAGKTKHTALHLLLSLPGIEQASISWGDDTRLPKDSKYIHVQEYGEVTR